MKSCYDIRSLVSGTLEFKVARVLERISKDADSFSLYLNYAYPEHTELWYFSEGKTTEWINAKTLLEKLGFKVSFVSKTSYYSNQPSATIWERGTLINWS